MQRVLIIVSLLFAFSATAQKNIAGIVLTKGQKIIIRSTGSQNADMGMGMEMKNFTSAENELEVVEVAENNYKIKKTLTGVKFSMDFMGQSSSYDSDKKEDSASELGKNIPDLNIPDTFTLDKFTGKADFKAKTDSLVLDEANPMNAMIKPFTDASDDMILDAFFLIPKGKKPGDKWSDSTSLKDVKSIKEYIFQKLENGIATVQQKLRLENNTQTELSGMQVAISMITKSTTDITLDAITSLVTKRVSKSTIEGSLEMMGQSVPVSGTSEITTTYGK